MSRGGVVGCAVLSCVRFETKVSDARACVEKRSHLVVVALFVIVRVTNRASSEESDRTSSVLLSNQNQRRARSFASSVHAPSARLHARIRALGRCVRDHSSLSRGHRRRGREPLCSRSRCVVREVIHSPCTHSLIHSLIHSSLIHVARLVDRARDSFPRTRDSPSRVPAPR